MNKLDYTHFFKFMVLVLTFIFCLFIYIVFAENERKIKKDIDLVNYHWVADDDEMNICFLFVDEPDEFLLMDALIYYDVKHKDIVLAQAILETGKFTSNVCKKHNNLFGLYNSNKKQYYKFSHWSESVTAYVNMIQYRHIEGEDYYNFLERIGYAEDKNYINKLKKIVYG